MSKPIVIDNTAPPPVSFTGRWEPHRGYGVDKTVHDGLPGNGSGAFTWTFHGLAPGNYRVSATWVPWTNRATDSPYRVYDGDRMVGQARLNQQKSPSGFTDDGTTWDDVGTFPVAGTVAKVCLCNDANGRVIADAVRLEKVDELPPGPPPSAFTITLRYIDDSLTSSQKAVFQRAADRWSEIIVGDLPDAKFNGYWIYPAADVNDILIDATAPAIDGRGGVLGNAGPDIVRPAGLPVHGTMRFDSADVAALEASGGLYYVCLHEMAHCLGFGTLWQSKGLVDGTNFVGENAVREYGGPVPLETNGGAGTVGSHWAESVFANEIMTGYLSNGVNPISRLTIASLQDLGYVCNLDAADPFVMKSQSAGGSERVRID